MAGTAGERASRLFGSSARNRRRPSDVEQELPPQDDDSSSDDEPDVQHECPGCGCRMSGRMFACAWLCVSTIFTQILLFGFAEPLGLVDGRAHPDAPTAPSSPTDAPTLGVPVPSERSAGRPTDRGEPLSMSKTPPPEGPNLVAVLQSLDQCVHFARDDPRHLDVTLVSHSSNNRLWSALTPRTPPSRSRAPTRHPPPPATATARSRAAASLARLIGASRAQWCLTSATGGAGRLYCRSSPRSQA